MLADSDQRGASRNDGILAAASSAARGGRSAYTDGGFERRVAAARAVPGTMESIFGSGEASVVAGLVISILINPHRQAPCLRAVLQLPRPRASDDLPTNRCARCATDPACQKH